MKTCWNGDQKFLQADTCPAQPPAMKTCWDGSEVLASAYMSGVLSVTHVQTDLSFLTNQSVKSSVSGETALCAENYRQEIIYYDFDKGQSAETRNTIQRILDTNQYCAVDNIRVVGHTDTSGSAAYNLALSKRRAKDAREELVRQGVNGCDNHIRRQRRNRAICSDW